MAAARFCRLPDDILCHIVGLLDAHELMAIERVCRRLRQLLAALGWRVWLRSMGWHFASCPVARLRALTMPGRPRCDERASKDGARIRQQHRHITAGPCYLARIGATADRLWHEQAPASYLLDQHAEAAGPVVRASRTFIAWTVGSQVKWTYASSKQWPVAEIHRTNTLRAHGADLTDLALDVADTDERRANIVVAGVDGALASWDIGTAVRADARDSKAGRNARLVWRMPLAGHGVQRIQQRATAPHRLISASHDRQLRVVDTGRRIVADQISLPDRPWALHWLADDVLAVGLFGAPHSLAIYRLRPEGVERDRFLLGHRASVYGLDACPQAPSLLLSGGYEGETRLWDLRVASGDHHGCVARFEDRFNDTAVYCCQWDGQRVASGRGRHGVVDFWDARWPAWSSMSQQQCALDGGTAARMSPLRRTDVWTKYNGRRWTPVYSLCLEQTRVLAALETELWWLDFTGRPLAMPAQRRTATTAKKAKRKPDRQRRRTGRTSSGWPPHGQ
ncbi:WD40-repeat-containing domain protein [Syncephalis pseudoplumigaleata]|uniref:WD40-repeat-containing domain protein n=1 Tax=Syncephalis pseudoplumigaleata TaxID=1712513 RepID=A0A4P9Z3A4_9FUNG|nr:WD40-repeat-containing domain protein [Syncephalis pseudoplumigaleata]|eukprot:RKP26885.1 WD40-repeat-containing domain protein [Syncephalis pseudoplumigaleata]